MYLSAHFMGSRFASGFYGYPMPSSLPDYPAWRQVRDYVRGFARAYDLPRHISLVVAVTSAEPLPGNRWSITLSTGESRAYDGLIAAPGVTWHPNIPDLPGADVFTGELRHSVTFRDGIGLRGKRVLVIGGGNSGADIACDAAGTPTRHTSRSAAAIAISPSTSSASPQTRCCPA